MARTSDKMIVMSIALPEGFSKQIDEILEDELKIAQKKWDVKLASDEIERVLTYSKLQLESNTSGLIKNEWKLDQPNLFVNIRTEKSGVDYTNYEKMLKSNPDATFIFIHNEWQTTNEPTTDSVHIVDFRNTIINWILKSARWAVFYGVASYAE